MNALLSVISIHGGTITEEFLGRINICEFCGEEVIPNGNTRTVRILDPLTAWRLPDTRPNPLLRWTISQLTRAAPQATPDISTRKDSAAAPQVYIEPTWRRGGKITAEYRAPWSLPPKIPPPGVADLRTGCPGAKAHPVETRVPTPTTLDLPTNQQQTSHMEQIRLS